MNIFHLGRNYANIFPRFFRMKQKKKEKKKKKEKPTEKGEERKEINSEVKHNLPRDRIILEEQTSWKSLRKTLTRKRKNVIGEEGRTFVERKIRIKWWWGERV